ncbi:MAG TPA: hypothetical protein VMF08_16820 [Candidatus Sulfotelmatobacter sp.]|nr:hypothetical protein [Candidatus Sulfotelmatobacter sp.]
MNPEAGRGAPLTVMVRVNDSKPLPFIMDTGAGMTDLDSSLEPQLGTRIGNASVANFGVLLSGGAYRPPRLYLGDTPLETGIYVATLDFKRWFKDPRCPYMGILGIDVLKHYCVQLDFQSGKVRFLDAARADKKDWGRPFHLTYTWSDCMIIDENLTGAKGAHSMLDTGDNADGFLTPKLYQQWTNQSAPLANGEFRSPNGTLGGEMYHDLDLVGLQKSQLDNHTRFNTIGLHVLSENLVTFDFPERTMYLKRTSDWPLLDKETQAATDSVGQSAADFSHSLRVKGQLPGWTTNDVPENGVAHWTHQTNGLDLVTLDEQKKGGSSVYHYTFTRQTQSSPWKLEKAWLTDQGEKTIEEYPVP